MIKLIEGRRLRGQRPVGLAKSPIHLSNFQAKRENVLSVIIGMLFVQSNRPPVEKTQ